MKKRNLKIYIALIIMIILILILGKLEPIQREKAKEEYTRQDLRKDAVELNKQSKLPFEYLGLVQNKELIKNYTSKKDFFIEKDNKSSKVYVKRLIDDKDNLYYTRMEFSDEKYNLFGIKTFNHINDANEILSDKGFKPKKYENLGLTMRKGFIVVKFETDDQELITKTYIYTIGY